MIGGVYKITEVGGQATDGFIKGRQNMDPILIANDCGEQTKKLKSRNSMQTGYPAST